jgi:basic membrane lipoprotein Med (substrate-binding protein (PBP1-ABC) superfamily)
LLALQRIRRETSAALKRSVAPPQRSMRMSPRTAVVLALLVAVAAAVSPRTGTLRTCYFFNTSPDDLGWTFTHNIARLRTHDTLTKAYPNATILSPVVYDMAPLSYNASRGAELQAFLRAAIAGTGTGSGCDVVVHNSHNLFGSNAQESALAVAHPAVKFMLLSYFRIYEAHQPNLQWYGHTLNSALFVAGAAAGKQATTCIGFMVPFAGMFGGFEFGVRTVNPTIPVHVVTTGEWSFVDAELDIADQYLAMGCEVIGRYSNSRDVDIHVKAKTAGAVMTVGIHSNLQQYVGDSVLAASWSNWDGHWIPQLKSIFDGASFDNSTWPNMYRLSTGVTVSTDVSPLAKPSARAAFNAAKATIYANGDRMFCGPLTYIDGTPVPHYRGTGCLDAHVLPANFFTVAGVTHHGKWRHRDVCIAGQSYAYRHTPLLAVACSDCAAGTHSTSKGSAACRPCDAGDFSTAGSTNCSKCVAGSFSAAAGSAACTPCPAGTASSSVAATECNACPAGFESAAGAAVCSKVADWTWLGFIAAVVVIAGAIPIAYAANRARAIRNCPRDEQHAFTAIFLGIKHETAMWDCHPADMPGAAKFLHTVVRELAATHRCYVARRVGEGTYLVVSKDAARGVQFAADVQRTMWGTEWGELFTAPASQGVGPAPASASTASAARREQTSSTRTGRSNASARSQTYLSTSNSVATHAAVAGRLSVNIGVWVGRGNISYDEQTHAYHYSGDAVDCAAELTDLAAGGQVLLQDELAKFLLDHGAAPAACVTEFCRRKLHHASVLPVPVFQYDAPGLPVTAHERPRPQDDAEGAIHGALQQADCGVTVRRVCVVVVFVPALLNEEARLTREGHVALASRAVEVVHAVAESHRGHFYAVADGRFMVSINAAIKASQVASRGGAIAVSVVAALRKQLQLPATAGVAVSSAIVGSVAVGAAQVPTIIGTAEIRARALERFARHYAVPAMTTGQIEDEVGATVLTLAVDLVALPAADGEPRARPSVQRLVALLALQNEQEVMDEWLYALDKGNTFRAPSEQLRALQTGKAPGAAARPPVEGQPFADDLRAVLERIAGIVGGGASVTEYASQRADELRSVL